MRPPAWLNVDHNIAIERMRINAQRENHSLQTKKHAYLQKAVDCALMTPLEFRPH